jgi:transposase
MPDHFKPLDRDTLFLLPPSVQDWLPQDHLARYVVDLVGKLDLTPIRSSYAGRGSEAYQPEMMVALLFYGYATGTFSSRKLERATYDSVAVRFITANQHPEHDTISNFRLRFLGPLEACFEQILLIAAESGLLKVGRVSIDGTKVKANASKHHALSYSHATKLERRIKREVQRLMRMAEKADSSERPDVLDIPAELARREDRLKAIEEAKKRIREREEQRLAAERSEYERKMKVRREREEETGKKTGGRKPKPPSHTIDPKAQINLTDEQSRIMPSSSGMMQAYNAQAVVDCQSQLVLSAEVSQRPTDCTLLADAVTACQALPHELGAVKELLADAGYCSKENVMLCEAASITPFISFGREAHAGGLQRFRKPKELADNATPVDRARHRLKTPEGRAIYGQRKATVEPVFGIVKQTLGFRQFLLRGINKVRGEWKLVNAARNIKRMERLQTRRMTAWAW